MTRLESLVSQAARVAIIGHVNPDGDCVGSCLAAWNYFTMQHPEKEITVYLDSPPEKFSYLNGFDRISQNFDPENPVDLCICLDSSDAERLGNFAPCFTGAAQSICIDHHITNTGYAGENLVDVKASSTCEALFGQLSEEKIDQAVAECIYTGIIHDTNVFKNSNTTAATMAIAGKMMEKGINFGAIIDDSFYRRTYLQSQILGRALLESVEFMDKKCIFTVIHQKDMKFYGVDRSDLDGIVDQMRIIDGVECAIFLTEVESHTYKVSMRSKEAVDVSKVAAYFGGGGHVRAAGCTMNGRSHDVINNLAVHIEKQLMQENARV